jgi:hypothetical protein
VDADAGGDDGMKELIDKQKALADLKGIKDVIQSQGDPFLANIIERAIRCVERQPVVSTAGVDFAHE